MYPLAFGNGFEGDKFFKRLLLGKVNSGFGHRVKTNAAHSQGVVARIVKRDPVMAAVVAVHGSRFTEIILAQRDLCLRQRFPRCIDDRALEAGGQ